LSLTISSGFWSLIGSNSHRGTTTLSGGTLTLGNAGALGTTTFTIGGGNLDSSVANLVNSRNNPQNWNGNFTFLGTQSFDLGTGAVAMAATRIVTVNSNATLAVGGVVSGAGGLVKAGAGTLKLTGNNTYTNDTFVNAGTLALDGSSALKDTTSLWITNEASVYLAAGVNEVVSNLYLNGVIAYRGTWGSMASSAGHRKDGCFSGPGILTVLDGPMGIDRGMLLIVR
jgi:autotransporter-associated beta strand protein